MNAEEFAKANAGKLFKCNKGVGRVVGINETYPGYVALQLGVVGSKLRTPTVSDVAIGADVWGVYHADLIPHTDGSLPHGRVCVEEWKKGACAVCGTGDLKKCSDVALRYAFSLGNPIAHVQCWDAITNMNQAAVVEALRTHVGDNPAWVKLEVTTTSAVPNKPVTLVPRKPVEMPAVAPHVDPRLSAAHLFFCGLNVQDFPVATQREYLKHIRALGEMVRGKK